MAYFHDRIYVAFLGFVRIRAQDIIRILSVQVLREFLRNNYSILCSNTTNSVDLQLSAYFYLESRLLGIDSGGSQINRGETIF